MTHNTEHKLITALLIYSSFWLSPLTLASEAEHAFAEMQQELQQYKQQHSNSQQQKNEFEQWRQQQQQDYLNYKQAYFKALKDYKTQILTHWQAAEVTDKKSWVVYSEDLQTKRVLDFENNEIRISLLNQEIDEDNIKALISQNLSQLLAQTPNSARKNDPVLNKAGTVIDSSDNISRQTMLSELYPNTDKTLLEQATELSQQAVITPSDYNNQTSGDYIKPTIVTIKLPDNSLGQRAEKYQNLVSSHAHTQHLAPSLIFAIMHTESAFNPMARSHVPAYGLMQIVPESAGRDVAMRLYGKDQLLSAAYLYNAANNVQAGATYLNILYYSYLKGIQNPLSRLYCVIAAYNTGAGNVAAAFVKERNLNMAFNSINQLSPDQVYYQLIHHLPYQETRDYLQRVVARQKLYGNAVSSS